MTNLMAYDYRDIKVINAETQKEINDYSLLRVRDYIACVLIARNVGHINERIQVGKPLVFLEINFDDTFISGYEVQNILKDLFESQYSDFSL